jgi:hypothetical protein
LSKFFGSFFQKEPLSLPLAFRGGDLLTRAITKTFDKLGLDLSGQSEPRFAELFAAFLQKRRVFCLSLLRKTKP